MRTSVRIPRLPLRLIASAFRLPRGYGVFVKPAGMSNSDAFAAPSARTLPRSVKKPIPPAPLAAGAGVGPPAPFIDTNVYIESLPGGTGGPELWYVNVGRQPPAAGGGAATSLALSGIGGGRLSGHEFTAGWLSAERYSVVWIDAPPLRQLPVACVSAKDAVEA